MTKILSTCQKEGFITMPSKASNDSHQGHCTIHPMLTLVLKKTPLCSSRLAQACHGGCLSTNLGLPKSLLAFDRLFGDGLGRGSRAAQFRVLELHDCLQLFLEADSASDQCLSAEK